MSKINGADLVRLGVLLGEARQLVRQMEGKLPKPQPGWVTARKPAPPGPPADTNPTSRPYYGKRPRPGDAWLWALIVAILAGFSFVSWLMWGSM